MKHSIKRQMAVVCTGLVAFTLIALMIINGCFLERYYVKNKTDYFVQVYNILEEAAKKGTIQREAVESELSKLAEKGNISYIIISAGGSGAPIWQAEHEEGMLLRQLLGYISGQQQAGGTMLAETENYQIQKITDQKNNSEYIEMCGTMSDDYLISMRSPLESIRESVDIANKFLAYMGVVMILISAVLVWYFSKRITDPILELACLSQRMADLDFDAKYTSGGDNEIGVLGVNFNTMSERLEKAVSELKSANFELQKDIEKKEKIDSMRTEFLANVSHELKTPIALIQGYAEGLKEGISDDPESREFYCDVIMDEADKMNKMVKNLLTLNQLEFGDEAVEFERFDIADLIRGVLQSCEILIQQKEVKMNFLQSEPVYVWADEFKAEQVIRNYVSNALNHVDGDMVIEIKVLKENEKARITVFNTGKPIPEEDVDRIWDKFYKVDKARTREYGGNGIGLSIVKAIMDSFHQKFGVTNYDNGVQFWFELDLK